jgi:hypothetical protein
VIRRLLDSLLSGLASASALAFARALMTTKARAVFSVHSSSRVNSFVLVTNSEEKDEGLPFDAVPASTGAIEERALLSLARSIVLSVCDLRVSMASFSIRKFSIRKFSIRK